jgi:hypothetical protein
MSFGDLIVALSLLIIIAVAAYGVIICLMTR